MDNEQIIGNAYKTAGGVLEPTGRRMDAPCCDVLAQLGVLGALDAAVRPDVRA